jgi:hypothetical protein
MGCAKYNWGTRYVSCKIINSDDNGFQIQFTDTVQDCVEERWVKKTDVDLPSYGDRIYC